jgi:hypothetical protein
MVAHATFHWPLEAPLDAKEAGARLAAAKKWRLSRRRASIGEYWVRVRHQRWMTEEEAAAQPHRTLLEDNPTSG